MITLEIMREDPVFPRFFPAQMCHSAFPQTCCEPGIPHPVKGHITIRNKLYSNDSLYNKQFTIHKSRFEYCTYSIVHKRDQLVGCFRIHHDNSSVESRTLSYLMSTSVQMFILGIRIEPEQELFTPFWSLLSDGKQMVVGQVIKITSMSDETHDSTIYPWTLDTIHYGYLLCDIIQVTCIE